MPDMLLVGHGGAIATHHVIAVASLKSAPVQRLLKAAPPSRVLDLTYGYPRQAIILFADGWIVVSNRTADELAKALHQAEGDHAEPWW